VVPSASVVAVEVPVDSRMTIVRTVVIVGNDDKLPPGISVACDSVVSKGNWLVVQTGKCLRDKYIWLKGALDKSHGSGTLDRPVSQ
jgi:hypothetical protein